MLRNIVGSWLLAAFLVVVAVATWRVLDVNRSCPSHASCPHAHATVVEAAPLPPPPVEPAEPTADEPPPVAHTCGAGAAAFDPPPPPPPAPVAHTCGSGADVPDVVAGDPFAPADAIDDAQAADEFQAAVESFRTKDNATACSHLHHVVVAAHAHSKWAEKSTNLMKLRCMH